MSTLPPLPASESDSGRTRRVSLPLVLIIGMLVMASALGVWWLSYQASLSTYPPFDLADLMIRAAPGDVAVWAIANLQFAARDLALVGGVLLFLLAGALFGLMLRYSPDPRNAMTVGGIAGAGCTALAILNNTTGGVWWVLWLSTWFGITLAIPYAIAARSMRSLHRTLNDTSDAPADWTEMNRTYARRDVVRNAVVMVATLGVGGWLGGMLVRGVGIGRVETADAVPLDNRRAEIEQASDSAGTLPTPVPAEELEDGFIAPQGVRDRLTPNEDFYTVDITTRKPALPDDTWTLRIHGLVDEPLVLSYTDLLNMPAVDQFGTLMCISYTHDSNLIGNTMWTGVPLRDVLQMTGIQDSAVELVLRGAGGYSDSITVEKALESGTLLAYGMNGETLPRGHGFPCRLYVPDIYGEKNVKWLQEIEVVDYDYKGYWQERGWSDSAVVNTFATIDTPTGGWTPDDEGIVPIGGIAFAGSRGIRSVSVRLGDDEWVEAEVEPYDPELVWQRWRYDWRPEPGDYRIAVRATDSTGMEQETEEREPYPDGMTGLHEVSVSIS